MTTSTMSENVATVMSIYEAFGKGDVAGFLSYIAEDCAWDFTFDPDASIPWLRGGVGPSQAAGFFEQMGTHLDVKSFELRHLATNEEERLVVVIFDIDCTVRATGKRIYEQYEPHLWYFNEAGKVCRFRHAADTLMQYRALQA